MKDKVTEAHATMERSLMEHQERTKQIEEEFNNKEFNLRDSLKQQMDKLIREQTDDINGM